MKTVSVNKIRGSAGMTLMELLISMALGVFLLLVIIMMYASAQQTFRLQGGLTRVQEDGRVAMHLISEQVRLAGFRSPVWTNPLAGYSPLTDGSTNGADGANDTLQLMYMDPEDCAGVINTAIDPETTEPRADYKRITFAVDASGMLRLNCDYGADPQNLQTQIADQTIVDGVESFQVLYGVDTDFPPDYSINAWTTVDTFNPEASVCVQSHYLCEIGNLLGSVPDGMPSSIMVGLLLASPAAAGAATAQEQITVLDVIFTAPNDHRLRKAFTATIALRNLTL